MLFDNLDRGAVFELIGYDILVDENMKPWLLEINHTPSLAQETNIGNSVKAAMIHDLFDLIDVEGKDKLDIQAETDRRFAALLNSYNLVIFQYLLLP